VNEGPKSESDPLAQFGECVSWRLHNLMGRGPPGGGEILRGVGH